MCVSDELKVSVLIIFAFSYSHIAASTFPVMFAIPTDTESLSATSEQTHILPVLVIWGSYLHFHFSLMK